LCLFVLFVLSPFRERLFIFFGVWILRSALLRSTTLNPVDYLEHLISKVNWVNFKINSVLPSLLLVFVEKVLTCLFTPPSRQLSRSLHHGCHGHRTSRHRRRDNNQLPRLRSYTMVMSETQTSHKKTHQQDPILCGRRTS
jgi:hypothetical protein